MHTCKKCTRRARKGTAGGRTYIYRRIINSNLNKITYISYVASNPPGQAAAKNPGPFPLFPKEACFLTGQKVAPFFGKANSMGLEFHTHTPDEAPPQIDSSQAPPPATHTQLSTTNREKEANSSMGVEKEILTPAPAGAQRPQK